jgi:glycosyltransferase involved in cell wall biosynthesis
MSRLEKTTLDALVRLACRRCTKIIAVSSFSKEEIIRYSFAEEGKVIAIPEGVDPAFADPVTDRETLSEFTQSILADRPYVLCVAHSYPHKNVHLLVEAFAQLSEHIPHNLVIIGKERRGEPLVRAAVDRLPDRNRLYRLSEGVSFRLLRLLYQRAALFVLPSAYERFGLPVLEAMMAGTPVLATNRASLPEVAGRHANVLENLDPIEMAGKIRTILQRDSQSEQQGRRDAARAWARGFTWQSGAQATIATLISACGKGVQRWARSPSSLILPSAGLVRSPS